MHATQKARLLFVEWRNGHVAKGRLLANSIKTSTPSSSVGLIDVLSVRPLLLSNYQSGNVVMGDDLILRLPPLLLVKLERGAAHLEMSRNAYITSILRRALEGGRPTIFTADPDELSSENSRAAIPLDCIPSCGKGV